MEPRSPREVALPSFVLPRLLGAVRDEAGPTVAFRALQAAGYQAGESLADGLLAEGAPVGARTFWTRLGEHLGTHGWGAIEHRDIHPGLGVLSSPDWAESEGDGEVSPACAYTVGLLAAVLSKAAGASVAVLETECRSCGDERCAFVFGSETAVKSVHEQLLDGRGLDAALARI